jgi:predicted nucleotidyltransferase
MRIERNQTIAGFPAIKVRQAMRDHLDRAIRIDRFADLLGCSQLTSEGVLKVLEREGFVERVGDFLKPSLRGSALAQATASKPLRRGTAERLASDVVHRAELVNATDIFAYRVKTMVLFGSFLSGADRISDVDIACELVPRWAGEEQDEAEEFSRALHEGRFRNASECVAWPKLEVLQYLKSRSRGLSIQELSGWILKQDRHLVIFSDGL